MDMIGKLDLNSLGNMGSLFGGGASNVNGLMNSGGGIVDALLGNKVGGIVDVISNLSGLKSGSSSSLLKMAAPFLLSIIGNQIKGKGVSFLSELLGGQKSFVKAALPAGLGNVMNFGDFGGSSTQKTTVSGGSSASTGGGNNWLKWLLPLLLLGGLLWWFTKDGCGKKVEETVGDAVATVDSAAMKAAGAAGAAVDSMGAAVENLFKYKLSTGFELVGAAKDGIESQLVTFVEDASKPVDKNLWFNFDRLLFDTGKATLQPSSQEQLKNIAEIMKAFPKLKVKLGGYTDNVGDPKSNLKLSTDRAFNVMNELVAMGVAKDRLSAEGYGDKHPVADNNTEEGRQQNRRIAVRVVEK